MHSAHLQLVKLSFLPCSVAHRCCCRTLPRATAIVFAAANVTAAASATATARRYVAVVTWCRQGCVVSALDECLGL
jgi:hypothetical protein